MTKNGLGAVCEHLVQKCWLLVALVCFSVLPGWLYGCAVPGMGKGTVITDQKVRNRLLS